EGILNRTDSKQVADSDMQHFPALERPQVVKLRPLTVEYFQRPDDLLAKRSAPSAVVKNRGICHPIEILGIPNQSFRQIRTRAQDFSQDFDRQRRVPQE